jgi:hypothetical protein
MLSASSRSRAARHPSLHPGRDLRRRNPRCQQQAGQRVARVDRLPSGGVPVQRQEELAVGEVPGQPVRGVHREGRFADPGAWPCLAASTFVAGPRPRAAATNSARTGSVRPSASASRPAVSRWAVRWTPRSRSLTDRGDRLAASASSSCVNPASARSCRSNPANLRSVCSATALNAPEKPARGRRPGTDWTHSHSLRTPDQPSQPPAPASLGNPPLRWHPAPQSPPGPPNPYHAAAPGAVRTATSGRAELCGCSRGPSRVVNPSAAGDAGADHR